MYTLMVLALPLRTMGRDLRPGILGELSSPDLVHETHRKACRTALRIIFFAFRRKVLHHFFGFDISQ